MVLYMSVQCEGSNIYRIQTVKDVVRIRVRIHQGALQDKKAKTVKTAMQEIVCDFQVAIGKGNTFVVRVHSDNDNSLIAEVKDYLRKECIEQTFTEPYDHNANAKVWLQYSEFFGQDSSLYR